MSEGFEIDIRRITNRNDPLFADAVHVFTLSFHNNQHTVQSASSLVGGNLTLLSDLTTAVFAASLPAANLQVALWESEVVGVICWSHPGRKLKLAGSPDWELFMDKMSDEGKKWYQDIYYPAVNKLAMATFPGGPATLNSYSIEALGVHPSHRRKGIGRELARICLNEAECDPHTEDSIVWVITAEGAPLYEACGMKQTCHLELPSPFGDFSFTSLVWTRGK